MFLDKYVKLTDRNCYPMPLSFSELHDAKSRCNNDSMCGGVRDLACNEDGSYSYFELCENYDYSIYASYGSNICVYKKTSKSAEFLLFMRNIFESFLNFYAIGYSIVLIFHYFLYDY